MRRRNNYKGVEGGFKPESGKSNKRSRRENKTEKWRAESDSEESLSYPQWLLGKTTTTTHELKTIVKTQTTSTQAIIKDAREAIT